MAVNRLLRTLVMACLCGVTAASAQTPSATPTPSAAPASPHAIRLDVVVDTKSGQPVTNLREQDFTLIDNKTPLPIRSFRVVTPAQEPVRVILLLDTVNTPYNMVTYMRQGVASYLKANEGKLAQPTAIAVLTDSGTSIANRFSTDGLALNANLDRTPIGLRQITRDSQWGQEDLLQMSMKSFDSLITYASTFPGRKMILWISPGWPLISPPGMYFTNSQEQQIFSTIIAYSTRLRDAGVTLYNINPVGTGESLIRADYYENFLQGVTRPSDAVPGDVGVQVLAVQSGGLAFESNSDVAGMIRKCLNDANSWYEITFDPPPANKPNEYHHIEIKVDQRGLIARTRDGYYSNPAAISGH